MQQQHPAPVARGDCWGPVAASPQQGRPLPRPPAAAAAAVRLRLLLRRLLLHPLLLQQQLLLLMAGTVPGVAGEAGTLPSGC